MARGRQRRFPLVQVQHARDAAVQARAQSHLPAWPVKATGCPKQVQP